VLRPFVYFSDSVLRDRLMAALEAFCFTQGHIANANVRVQTVLPQTMCFE
jgi:hypothetical protein